MRGLKPIFFLFLTLLFGYQDGWAKHNLIEESEPCCSSESGCCELDSCCDQDFNDEGKSCCPGDECCDDGDCCGGDSESCEPSRE